MTVLARSSMSSPCLQQRADGGGYPHYMFGEVLGGGYRAPAAHQQHAAYTQPQPPASTGLARFSIRQRKYNSVGRGRGGGKREIPTSKERCDMNSSPSPNRFGTYPSIAAYAASLQGNDVRPDRRSVVTKQRAGREKKTSVTKTADLLFEMEGAAVRPRSHCFKRP
ncbi:hypothetical protein EVAR_58155_1 [Eumeta japonica]|uniref:Uncharacterized protein n=1 Tax=Eumeta variegata TaxID=151549 RepID=A0A4C1WYU1_EUMVA|nr:hypothetical protein EVAR_58155_1 [Eumeta japonica]